MFLKSSKSETGRYLAFEPVDGLDVRVNFASDMPSEFVYDGKRIKSVSDYVSRNFYVRLEDFACLYATLCFMEKDKGFCKEGMSIRDAYYDYARMLFYVSKDKPMVLQIKYIDYVLKESAVIFIDTTDIRFGYLLAHMRMVLSYYLVIPFTLNGIDYTYNRADKELTVSINDEFVVIKRENIELMKSIYHSMLTTGINWNTYLDEDNRISIANGKLFIDNIRQGELDFYKIIAIAST